MTAFSTARTVLIRLATPAALSRCPMFVLIEPRAQEPVVPPRPFADPKTAVSASTSTGSPNGVPVPWAST